MDLKALRLEKGWSQAELARVSDLSERTIQRIEAGRPASLEARKALAASFGISFAEIEARLTPAPVARSPRPARSSLWMHGASALVSTLILVALVARFDADMRVALGTGLLALAGWLVHLAIHLHRRRARGSRAA